MDGIDTQRLARTYEPVLLFSRDGQGVDESFFPMDAAQFVAGSRLYAEGTTLVRPAGGLTLEVLAALPESEYSMRLFLRIQAESAADGAAQDRIAAASFLTSGCPASIATSSVATEMIAGLTLLEAEALTRDDYANAIGGLPKSKQHCSVLARAAVRAAIENWRASPPAGEAVDAGT